MAESTTDIEERMHRSRPVSPCSLKLKGHKTEYSHKLTEKRRRDRMNISMSEIAQLLPSSPASKQLEKAEILEKTISYIKKLQDLTGDKCMRMRSENENSHSDETQNVTAEDGKPPSAQLELTPNYYNGFSDCIKEVFHCLTNVEAMDLEQPCFQRLMGHLQNELQFMGAETTEGNDSENNHKDNQNKKCLSATSNGNISSLPPSKSCHESWRHKRIHEKTEIENDTRRQNPVAKIPRLDSDKNSCSDGNGSSTSSESVSSSIKKEKRKASFGTGCTSWDGKKGINSNTGGCSVGSDKDKEAISSSLKQDASNIFDRANIDGGGCGPESAAVNSNWPNLGLDMPIQATPLSPRTPYIPNPYTLPTYALHPSGTHFIPVVLHLSFPLPPFPEMKSVPNWYFTALNCMRMGNLQFPHFSSGFPFATQVNGMVGLNGMQNTKNESDQKQCESKPRDVDSTNIEHEPSSVNESATRDLLTNV